MEISDQLQGLLELASDAGLEVRSVSGRAPAAGELPPASGVCRVKDSVWVVLSGADPPEAQVRVLATALREHAGDWLESRYVPPALRALL